MRRQQTKASVPTTEPKPLHTTPALKPHIQVDLLGTPSPAGQRPENHLSTAAAIDLPDVLIHGNWPQHSRIKLMQRFDHETPIPPQAGNTVDLLTSNEG